MRPNPIFAERSYPQTIAFLANAAIADPSELTRSRAPEKLFGLGRRPADDGHVGQLLAYRVPCAIRWPGVIKPGTVLNDIFSHEDMLPTLLAAAGAPNVKEELLRGMQVGDKTFKVHLDGYNVTEPPGCPPLA